MKGTEVFSEAAAVPGTLPPGKIWILGAGRFGSIAARRLTKRFPNSDFLVIDHRGERLEEIRQSLGLPVLRREAAAFLLEEPIPVMHGLYRPFPSMWLPVIPIGWAIFIRSPCRPPDAQVPTPTVLRTAPYASFATFICPMCATNRTRPASSPKATARKSFRTAPGHSGPLFDVVVVRSWQLAPELAAILPLIWTINE